MAISIAHTPLRVADLLIPKKHVDLYKWSVIACDQFTSNSTYWHQVESLIGDAPSSYHLMVPEIYFEDEHIYNKKLHSIPTKAHTYLQQNLFAHFEDTILLTERRRSRNASRKGIILQLDLNEYSDKPDIPNRVKTTESIIESRLPKRIACKAASPLDLSHILIIYEDQAHALQEALTHTVKDTVYSLDLMMDGGTIVAKTCNTNAAVHEISSFFKSKQNSGNDEAILAVGDGNHSLMSSKKIWEKNGADMNSLERWALVELVNIYDEGLEIEPIHRILYNADFEKFKEKLSAHGKCSTQNMNKESVLVQYDSNKQIFWHKYDKNRLSIEIIEDILQNTPNLFQNIDFIHSETEIKEICSRARSHIAICFQEFDRNLIFEMVHNKRYFPRKSFSLGSGEDKKYYIESTLRKKIDFVP